jgi:hypothetical protein
MKPLPTLNNLRFAPCVDGLRLLITLPAAARQVVAGEVAVLPSGFIFCDDFRPTPMNRKHLTRREICRGKISLRKKSTHLEERTPSAPNQ